MKRIILCIAFVLSCLPLLADGPEKKPHFCIEPGTRLYYERHRAGTGQLTQTFIPGETLPGARSEAVLSFCSILVEIFDREVLRHETVTTPAGTFPCAVVFFRKVEDAPFHKRDNWEEDYYTPGIGYVRHPVYGKDMKLIAVEELVRIERPQNDNLVTL